jgi:hypothetical protein
MARNEITLQLDALHARRLADRGAEAHPANAHFSPLAVLARRLNSLNLYQELTDPRWTRGMPEEVHALIVSEIPEPWVLRRCEIEHLDAVLADAPGFALALAAAGLDSAPVLAAVAAATPSEKLTLVQHAMRQQLAAHARRSE